jgi:translation initiation factor IF-3
MDSFFLATHCGCADWQKGDTIAFVRSQRREVRTRTNERIRVREVRVIDDEGEQLGIMSPQQAMSIAREKGLDLVEISPTAAPPVCRIMDYGKYHYKEQKATRDARKNQKSIELKEIKFRPKVDAHDYNFKKQAIERILSEGDKVKATMFFRGREMAHPDFGRRILDRLVDDLEGIATAEGRPAMMGNQMHIILSGVASAKTGVASAKKTQSA